MGTQSIKISELPKTDDIRGEDLFAVVNTNIDTTMKIETDTVKEYITKDVVEAIDTINEVLEEKQDKLVVGDNVNIDENNVISTPSYTAGANIHIDDYEISAEYLEYDDTEIKQDINSLQENKVDKIQGKGLSTNDFTDEYKNKVDNFEPYDDTEIKQDITNLSNNKVDKIDGKGLSTNDYTTEEKNKLSGVENGAEVNIIEDVKVNNVSQSISNKSVNITVPDVSNFITKNVDDLVNYYKKSETYTQSEVNNLIGAIQQFHYEIVQTLPSTGETNIMYLVPKVTTETQNVYDEYVYANNNFEKIGDTQIDLSDYVTTTMLNTALANYTTTTDLTTLLNAKQDSITSNSKLASDLVDDTNQTNKFVTANEKTAWGNKYDKPVNGIPKTDLASDVQTSLGKADSALQSETYTGTITSVKMNGTTIASSGEADLGTVITSHQDISGKQDVIQYSTMPTADATTVGKIIQYTGATNVSYINGYFYVGATDGESTPTYSWESVIQTATQQDIQDIFTHHHVFEHHRDIIGDEEICTDDYDLCTAPNCTEDANYKFNREFNTNHNYGQLQYKKRFGKDNFYIVCSTCGNSHTLTTSELENYTEEEKQQAIDDYEHGGA